MERVAPPTQDSEEKLGSYLGIPVDPTNTARQSLRRKLASLETFLCSNAFHILFLITYTISLALMFLWGAHDQYVLTETPKMRWIIAVARGFGYTLNLSCALVILLAARLLFTFLRETPLNLIMPFDKTFPNFHMIVGYTISVSVIGHALFHMIWIVLWDAWASGLWGISMCVATGIAVATILLAIVISSLPRVRKERFPVFYALHNFGAVLFFAVLTLHGVYNGVPYTYKWLIAPILVYAMDRIARKRKISTSCLNINQKHSILKEDDVIKISFAKQFNFRAGQYAEIKIPCLSKHEWHPFTIASAPFEQRMCFYIKCIGDWTKQLRLLLEKRMYDSNTIPMQLLVRGPYGAPAQHVRGYQRVVLLSGGVGATPFLSICKQLFYFMKKGRAIDQHGHQPSQPDSPAMKRAEVDIRNCLSELYQQSIRHSTDEEASISERPLLSEKDMFDMDHECGACFSPASKRSEKWFAQQNDYLDCVGVSFKKKRNLNFAGLSPIAMIREGRYTVFENDGLGSTIGQETFESADTVGAMFYETRASKLLMFLHSVTLNLLLCVAMLLRMTLILCVSIFRSTLFSFTQSSRTTREVALAWVDIGLGGFVFGILVFSCVTEIFHYKRDFFRRKGRVGDVFMLLPLCFSSLLFCFRAVLGTGFPFHPPTWAHLFVIFPILLVSLVFRLFRIIGAKVALADFSQEPSLEKLKAVDFIWTVPFEKDDGWLREELDPVADGNELRLYRFLTRQQKKPEDESVRGITTSYGRPDWDRLFMKLAERTPSGGKVGVFFCGPKTMSEAVVSSIMKIQVLSNLRGTYLGTTSRQTLQAELGVDENEIQRLLARGCNVRFVFREENFS